MSASDSVEFRLSDGTKLNVPDHEMRRIYEALWDLSTFPGAISTAALLLHEAHHTARFRHPVELTVAQGAVLKQALDRFAKASSPEWSTPSERG